LGARPAPLLKGPSNVASTLNCIDIWRSGIRSGGLGLPLAVRDVIREENGRGNLDVCNPLATLRCCGSEVNWARATILSGGGGLLIVSGPPITKLTQLLLHKGTATSAMNISTTLNHLVLRLRSLSRNVLHVAENSHLVATR